ncbi:MAG: CPBP family intramembrane glutamic endopeptidase [Rhodospirillales bacterium]
MLWLFCGSFAFLIFCWVKFLLPPVGTYVADYASRAVVVFAIVRSMGWAPFAGKPERPISAILFSVAVWYGFLIIDQVTLAAFPEGPLYMNWLYPPIDNVVLQWSDAIFGVALVAVSEELVFRYLPLQIGRGRGWSSLKIYAVSTVSFAVLHAPQGIVQVLDAGVFGIFAMLLYRRFGSLWLPIAVHFGVDFVLFSDLACWANIRTCT